MNKLHFDYIKDLKMPNDKNRVFGAVDTLHGLCCSAEKNAKTYPDTTMINIRQALEVLLRGLLIEDGMKNFSNQITLSNMIDMYAKRCSFINNKNVTPLHKVRMKANDIVHISYNVQGEKEYKIKDVHASAKESCKYTIELYKVIAEIFNIEVPEIHANDLPIGEYEIIEKSKSEYYESVEGKYKFIGRISSPNIDTYAYIRPFNGKKNNSRKVFNERDLEVQNFFMNMRGSSHIIRGHEIRTSDTCEMRYLAYEIQKNTKTLDRIIGEISAYDLLNIIAQVAQGLSELATKKINIHHRGIRPTCIFINSFDDGYEAKLGCFETAKIEYKEKIMETVMAYMVESQKDSVFVHPELLGKEEITGDEWEAGDVYSLAAVLLFCLDKEFVANGEVDCTILTEYYSDEFVEAMMNILITGAIDVVPTMKEFYAILVEEIENGED